MNETAPAKEKAQGVLAPYRKDPGLRIEALSQAVRVSLTHDVHETAEGIVKRAATFEEFLTRE